MSLTPLSPKVYPVGCVCTHDVQSLCAVWAPEDTRGKWSKSPSPEGCAAGPAVTTLQPRGPKTPLCAQLSPMVTSKVMGLSPFFRSIIEASRKAPNRKNSSIFPVQLCGEGGSNHPESLPACWGRGQASFCLQTEGLAVGDIPPSCGTRRPDTEGPVRLALQPVPGRKAALSSTRPTVARKGAEMGRAQAQAVGGDGSLAAS